MTTILAVDDSATMRTCLEMTFAGTDLRIVCCDGAAALLDELAVESPSLVLVDASLPPSSGYDLCAAIRASAPEVPILLLTSRQHPFDAARADVIDDYLDKPFDTQELYERAKALVLSGARPAAVTSAPQLEFADAELELDDASPLPAEALLGSDLPPPPFAAEPVAPVTGTAAPPAFDAGPVFDAGPAFDAGPVFDAGPAFDAGEPRVASLPPEPPAPVVRADSDPVSQDLADALEPVLTRPRGVTAAWEVPEELRARRAAFATFEPAKEAAREVTASWDMSSGEPRAVAAARLPSEQPVATSLAFDGERAGFAERLQALGLTEAQLEGVVALSREVIERVAWEVVPTLAETLIKEELRRLLQA